MSSPSAGITHARLSYQPGVLSSVRVASRSRVRRTSARAHHQQQGAASKHTGQVQAPQQSPAIHGLATGPGA
ncbi:hypothetical protein [Pseudomonas cremoricolorata]|uniref:hypothetical protein n=1 Tax=Pseudomonas cremoricolorata TaxID=157783 RepID=UPI0004076095|nr:hypothetical protein [Pseudomonas cremoricolorata]